MVRRPEGDVEEGRAGRAQERRVAYLETWTGQHSE